MELVAFFTYTGNSREVAWKLALQNKTDIIQIKESEKRSKFKTYIFGSFAAIKGKKTKIFISEGNIEKYKKIIIVCPIWAGYTPPAINAFIDEFLINGMEVGFILLCKSGRVEEKCMKRVKKMLEEKNCILIEHNVLKTK